MKRAAALSTRALASLPGRWLAVQASGEREVELLVRHLGVEPVCRARVMRAHVFARLPQLPRDAAQRALLQLLEDLPTLGEERPATESALAKLEFVPNRKGHLKVRARLPLS